MKNACPECGSIEIGRRYDPPRCECGCGWSGTPQDLVAGERDPDQAGYLYEFHLSPKADSGRQHYEFYRILADGPHVLRACTEQTFKTFCVAAQRVGYVVGFVRRAKWEYPEERP